MSSQNDPRDPSLETKIVPPPTWTQESFGTSKQSLVSTCGIVHHDSPRFYCRRSIDSGNDAGSCRSHDEEQVRNDECMSLEDEF